MKLFRIHASQCHKIMGRVGLTDAQHAKLDELILRRDTPGAKPLTANMVAELTSLQTTRNNPELPGTATTFLKEWYAGDREEIRSKYIDKGNMVEDDNIDLLARVTGYGIATKNTVTRSDEYMIGTCDVEFPDAIGETKAPWNNATLHDNIEGISPEHEWQLRVYIRLWDKSRGILFYGLQDTPEIDGREPVTFDHIPENERWIGYEIRRDQSKEQEMIDRVIMCRKWLEKHDRTVKAMLGKIHKV